MFTFQFMVASDTVFSSKPESELRETVDTVYKYASAPPRAWQLMCQIKVSVRFKKISKPN